jgi:hypothetical protein
MNKHLSEISGNTKEALNEIRKTMQDLEIKIYKPWK